MEPRHLLWDNSMAYQLLYCTFLYRFLQSKENHVYGKISEWSHECPGKIFLCDIWLRWCQTLLVSLENVVFLSALIWGTIEHYSSLLFMQSMYTGLLKNCITTMNSTFLVTGTTLTKWRPCQGYARAGGQDLNYCFWIPSCDTLSRRDENGVYRIDLHNALPPVARGKWVGKAGFRVIPGVYWCKEVSGQRIWSCLTIWFSVEGCCLQLCQPLSAHQARQVNKPPSPLIGCPEWCAIEGTQTKFSSSPSPCHHLSSDM